jgi:putative SOS response-associated peptidase YedK
MCGRFTLTTNLGAIARRFGVARFLEGAASQAPRYNIA